MSYCDELGCFLESPCLIHNRMASRVGTVLGTMTMGRAASVQTNKTVATKMLLALAQAQARPEIDTARMYQMGDTEKALGEIFKDHPELAAKLTIATKANAFPTHNKSLSAESTKAQCQQSLSDLGLKSVAIFYLHAPDEDVAIEETLRAVQELYKAGAFLEFGLSNYAAWEVMYIYQYCKSMGYVVPTVYQGGYNVIARNVESELLPCLRKCGMRFYAYNPLAGGMLSGKYKSTEIEAGRFSKNTVWGRKYQDRFMTSNHFDSIERIGEECKRVDISMADAALRWLVHHSALQAKNNDKVIMGASTMDYFEANFKSLVEAGPLPESLLKVLDDAWQLARPCSECYFRSFSGARLGRP